VTLIKTSFLNAIAVLVKIACSLVLNKILAIYVGPTGYAIIGQFQNAISILVNIAGGIVATGVTKVTAQHFDDQAKQHSLWKTALRFSLIASIITGVAVLLLRDSLAQWLLHRADMTSLFFWLAFAMPAMAANNILLAIINGKKEIGIYVATNIIGSIVGLVVSGLMTFYYNLYGILVAFIINPAVVLLTTAVVVQRRDWFKVEFLWGKMNGGCIRELSGFALMGLTSALMVPLSYMLIREHVAASLGLTAAGLWQASLKISEMYLMLVTSTLSVYYLPRIAEIKSESDLKYEISKVYRVVMPVVAVGAVIIYVLRDFIIKTLFSSEFMQMRDLFAWQLLGDVIKIGSWILAYVMLGRGMVRFFVILEIVFSLIFILLSYLLVNAIGLIGVPIAYIVNYIIYWVAIWVGVKREMHLMF
jgi:PST family polysaccharide transporter